MIFFYNKKNIFLFVGFIILIVLGFSIQTIFAVGFREWTVLDSSKMLAGANDIVIRTTSINDGLVYATGYDGGGSMGRWKTFIWRKINGLIPESLIVSEITSDIGVRADVARVIAANESGIYVAGFSQELDGANIIKRAKIEKRDHAGSLLWRKDGGLGGVPGWQSVSTALVLDDAGNAYLGGYTISSNNRNWDIQKLAAGDGGMLWGFQVRKGASSTLGAQPNSIVLDQLSGQLYIAGGGRASVSDAVTNWVIEKRSMNTGALSTDFDGDGVLAIDITGTREVATGIVMNGDLVSLTVVGSGQRIPDMMQIFKIQKISTTGVIDMGFDANDQNESGSDVLYQIPSTGAVAIDGSGLYIGGIFQVSSSIVSMPLEGFIEKRDLSDGHIIWRQGDSGTTSDYRQVNGLAADPGQNLYVASSYVGGFQMDKIKPVVEVKDFIKASHVAGLISEIKRIRTMAKFPSPSSWPAIAGPSQEIYRGQSIRKTHVQMLRDNYPASSTCASSAWTTGEISGNTIRAAHFNELSEAVDKLKNYMKAGDKIALIGGDSVTQCSNWQTLNAGNNAVGKYAWAISTYSRVTCDGVLQHRLEAWTVDGQTRKSICWTDWASVSGGTRLNCGGKLPQDSSITVRGYITWDNPTAYSSRCLKGALCTWGTWQHDGGGENDAQSNPCSANNFPKYR